MKARFLFLIAALACTSPSAETSNLSGEWSIVDSHPKRYVTLMQMGNTISGSSTFFHVSGEYRQGYVKLFFSEHPEYCDFRFEGQHLDSRLVGTSRLDDVACEETEPVAFMLTREDS